MVLAPGQAVAALPAVAVAVVALPEVAVGRRALAALKRRVVAALEQGLEPVVEPARKGPCAWKQASLHVELQVQMETVPRWAPPLALR